MRSDTTQYWSPTARADNVLLVFDTRKLTSEGTHSQVARVAVGQAPVGVAMINHGAQLIVTNSNRMLAPQANQDLAVIDASKVAEGSAAVTGTLPAGAFPRRIAPLS